MKKYLLASLIALSATIFAQENNSSQEIVVTSPTVVQKPSKSNIIIFGGLNINGELEDKYEKEDTENSFSFGLEYHRSLIRSETGNLELGIGMKYDSSMEIKEDGETFEIGSSLPVYASVKYSFLINDNTNIFIQGRAGYAHIEEGKIIDEENKEIRDLALEIGYNIDAKYELESGTFVGVGVGAEIGDLLLGLSYEITKFDGKYTGSDAKELAYVFDLPVTDKFEHSKLSLTVGYKFNF